MDQCDVCSSMLDTTITPVKVYHDRYGQQFIFEGVPARICSGCGANYFAAKEVRQMDTEMKEATVITLLEKPLESKKVIPKRVTVDEFDAFLLQPKNRDGLFELINGEIVRKMPTEEHGAIAGNVVYLLKNFLKTHKLGGYVGVEVSHRMPSEQYNSRQPNVSFSLTSRPLVREGSIPHMPDLAVEVKSPNDTIKSMREKAEYYLLNGARLVWLFFPHKRIIEVYTLDMIDILTEHDLLTGGDVLPDFAISVSEIFAE